MAPLLLNHLARSLTHQLAQMTRFSPSPFTPAAAGVYRFLSTLASAPFRRLTLPARVSFTQAPSSQSSTPLLGQCQQLACVVQPAAGMKTKTALKRRCKDCFVVRRRGRLFVICKTNPRHKQRQG